MCLLQIDPKPCNPRTQQKPKRSGGFPKVFLGGLPSNVTETDLRSFFTRFGKVMEVVIMYDQEKKKSRGEYDVIIICIYLNWHCLKWFPFITLMILNISLYLMMFCIYKSISFFNIMGTMVNNVLYKYLDIIILFIMCPKVQSEFLK